MSAPEICFCRFGLISISKFLGLRLLLILRAILFLGIHYIVLLDLFLGEMCEFLPVDHQIRVQIVLKISDCASISAAHVGMCTELQTCILKDSLIVSLSVVLFP
jgi:hypothetical protein